MFEFDIMDEGNALEVVVQWPQYLQQPLVFNSQWLDSTADGTVHRKSPRIIYSQKAPQDMQREFCEPTIKLKQELNYLVELRKMLWTERMRNWDF